MATPIRKKRNFKALALNVAQPVAPAPEPEPVATRQAPTAAPAAGGKKRPPPMTLKAPKIPAATGTPVEQEINLLTVANGSSSAPPTATSASARRMTYHTHLSHTIANMETKAETRFDLRNEDLKELQELGQGNGGSVKKVEHLPSKTIMAKKVRASTDILGQILPYDIRFR